ncbi:hypothetical protein Fcan01_01333 [Folsomia candida]|uniref:Uncharacterized protein n=1 Tax=Folsomia candida TaxID=158441 RepID=A0A226F6F3_FOLCA|nr:hypothetical protein Fcan01_01333 [Folsomia candida]
MPTSYTSKNVPLLSTQLLETYSTIFDTPFFEQRPIAWSAKKERFTISGSMSCKLYWFNVFIVLVFMNGSFTLVILRQLFHRQNSTWMGIWFPLCGFMIGGQFNFMLLTTYYATEVANLLQNLVAFERQILNGN